MNKKYKIASIVTIVLALIIAIVFGTVAMANQNTQPNNPDRLTMSGKIESVETGSFVLLEDAPYKASDKVVLKVDANTKIVDGSGKTLQLSELKAGQRVEVITPSVFTMMYPVQTYAYSIVVK